VHACACVQARVFKKSLMFFVELALWVRVTDIGTALT